MTSIDDACVFFKELAINYKVPCEMHWSGEGRVRIHIPRESLTARQVSEIREAALKRGLKDTSGDHWITLG